MAAATTEPCCDTSSETQTACQPFIGKKLRVKLTDHRTMQGILQCIDQEQNMILVQTTEFAQVDDISHQRDLGMIMVPGSHIVRVEMEIEQQDSQ